MALIDAYLTDEIILITYIKDINGHSIRLVSAVIPCRIEDKNQIVTNQNGQDVIGNSNIAMSQANNLIVNYNQKVQIKKKNNFDFPNGDKEFLIKNIGHPSGFSDDPGYIGVWI
jgi:hypothetical protein